MLKQIQPTHTPAAMSNNVPFEGIAKTNTTHTKRCTGRSSIMFEGIAKTNTTHTYSFSSSKQVQFEGIAKTNTTHTCAFADYADKSLRVLLKQIQPTPFDNFIQGNIV